jgi:hypothetical protein
MPKSKGPLNRLWEWIIDRISQEVPNQIALCEYDCRNLHCTLGEWEACQGRLHKSAGALIPANGDAFKQLAQ